MLVSCQHPKACQRERKIDSSWGRLAPCGDWWRNCWNHRHSPIIHNKIKNRRCPIWPNKRQRPCCKHCIGSVKRTPDTNTRLNWPPFWIVCHSFGPLTMSFANFGPFGPSPSCCQPIPSRATRNSNTSTNPSFSKRADNEWSMDWSHPSSLRIPMSRT